MPIEALLWSLLILISPILAARLWPSLRTRLETLPIDPVSFGPWVRSLGFPYLALILGSVSGRQVGMEGIPAESWIAGGLSCAAGLLFARFIQGRFGFVPDPEQDLSGTLREEARWGFYRGAAALWLPGRLYPLMGFGLILLELGIAHAQASGRHAPSPGAWKAAMRAALSTALFIATSNFWLTALTQLTLAAGLIRDKNSARNAQPSA